MKLLEATNEEWKEVLNEDNTATFFQSPLWYEVWKEYQNIDYKVYKIVANGITKAILPLVIQKRYKGILHPHYASPGGTYGGLLLSDSYSRLENHELEKLNTSFDSLRILCNPFSSQRYSKSEPTEFTQFIDLKKDFSSIFKSWSKGHSSAAKKAFREGVEISVVTENEDWDSYYEAYEDSLSRWGDSTSSRYQRKFFEILKGKKSNNIKLWKAEIDQKLIYGCLCFYHNNHVVYWHGAGLSDYFNLRAVHALQYAIIEHACENDYLWYDFNPSGGHEGVVKFKKGFGTQLKPVEIMKFKSMKSRLVEKLFSFVNV